MKRLKLSLMAGSLVLTGCSAAAAQPSDKQATARHRVVSSLASPDASTSQWPGHDGALSVVALGDSVLVPPGCDGCADFADAYAAGLGSRLGRQVHGTNLAVGGLKTAGLLAQLKDPATRSAVAQADVVVLVIGANDVAPLAADWQHSDPASWQPLLTSMGTTLGSILDEVHALRHGQSTRVLVSNYWNVVDDGQAARNSSGQDYLAWSHRLTLATNAVIATQARTHGDVVVDLVPVFRGSAGTNDPTSLLANDGDHPNAQGLAAMEKAFVAAT